MKLSRSIIKYTLPLALSGIAGCTGNYEEINRNPNEVTLDEQLRDDYIISAAMMNLQNWVVPTSVNTCQFTDCLLGGPLGGYFADSKSDWNEKISTYNASNNWMRVMFQDIIPEVYPSLSTIKTYATKDVHLGVATVLKVAVMHRITDTYGPIPYSKIGESGELQISYDSQQDIYNQFFDELNDAIDKLTTHRTEFFSNESDLIYNGEVEKWIKYANSLKLRLAMRIVYADAAKAKQMAEEAVNHEVGTITINTENAALPTFGTDGNPIYVATNVYNRDEKNRTGGDHQSSADITTYMKGYSDPRRAAYFLNSGTAGYEYTGLRSGIAIPSAAEVFKYSAVKISISSPLQWMNAAEVMFLKAEGALRGWNMGGTAKELYELGVTRSFEQWGVQGTSTYLADATSVPAVYVDPAGLYGYNNQLSGITIAWNDAAPFETNLERIIVQKWIANWTIGNESWAERRRTGYPKMMPVVYNGSGGVLADNAIPRRLPYPLEEYQTNTANVNSAVTNLLGGPDNMATRMWWDKKN